VASHRIPGVLVAGLLVVVAAIGYQLPASSSPKTPSDVKEHGGQHHGALGEAGGAISGDASVFDDELPGIARLDPDLLRALRAAATQAADDGVEFFVDSGWRSRAYQSRLFSEAVAKYGSQAEASRWVATPDTSAHVSGDAVDIGHADARAWLSEHGAGYGLCQTYGNEPWHYELRPEAVAGGCPSMYPDASERPVETARR
jgi:hypothetical protein